MPGDGVVVDGRSAVDETMLTGESNPVDKLAGSPLIGGTLNQSGALTMRIERAPTDTALARIMEAVAEARRGAPGLA